MINLVFVFMMLLNEPQKFTFHSSSRKNTKRLQTSLKCCLPFWASQTINSVFHQVVLTTSSYLEVGYQIDFGLRGWNKFNIEIVVDSQIPPSQLIVERRVNSQELIGFDSVYRWGWLELKENVAEGKRF